MTAERIGLGRRKAMEPAVAVQLAREATSQLGIRIVVLVGDDDVSTILRVRKAVNHKV